MLVVARLNLLAKTILSIVIAQFFSSQMTTLAV